jgi:hypothetical protein
VVAIAPDSPLHQVVRANGRAGTFRLVPGDVITQIDDRPVEDEGAYFTALDAASDEVFLTVEDHGTGRAERWVCRPASVQRRLGVRLGFRPEGGAVVAEVIPGSPTQRLRPAGGAGPVMRLVVGDVILRVNGEAVADLQTFQAALNGGLAEARLAVADGATGTESDWICGTAEVRSPEPPAAPRRRAWVVFVAQTADPILGEFIPVSLKKLQDLFRSQVASGRLRLRLLDGLDCTADGVLAAVRELPMAADDTLLVYYLGHGSYDPGVPPDDPTGGHYFDLTGGRLRRGDLRRELEGRPGRLKVLISDACNVPAVSDVVRPVAEMRVHLVEGLTATEKLLFNVRGVIDVEAASRSQYSWYGPPYGGWFTHVLVGLLRSDSWPDLLARLQVEANGFFVARKLRIASNPAGVEASTLNALRNQAEMRPKVFAADLRDDVAEADANDQTTRQVFEEVLRYVN